jgi:selenocysteine lyase/cysteine desulfurase
VAFTVANRPADEVAERLAEEAVFVSSGDFYATTVVARYGLTRTGLVRAGCSCYTTAEEIDRLIDGVVRLSGRG